MQHRFLLLIWLSTPSLCTSADLQLVLSSGAHWPKVWEWGIQNTFNFGLMGSIIADPWNQLKDGATDGENTPMRSEVTRRGSNRHCKTWVSQLFQFWMSKCTVPKRFICVTSETPCRFSDDHQTHLFSGSVLVDLGWRSRTWTQQTGFTF